MKTQFAAVRAVLASVANGPLADTPDAELLRRFAADRNEPAFVELVRRYGPLVWRVARTTVGHVQVAEDVFQATFLILAKQAAAVRNPGALAGWLHRTAYRAAVRARRREIRSHLPLPPHAAGEDPLDRLTARELLAAVDEEIEALPEALRAAVVLCGVEGLSQEEAAKRLGWSAGSVKGRLERARARLRKRLDARGLTIPAALVGVGVVPAAVVAATLTAARGEEASPAVAKLVAEGVEMNLSFWWKPALVAVASAGVISVGIASQSGGPRPEAPLRTAAAPVPGLSTPKLVLWSVPLRADGDNSSEEKAFSENRLAAFDGGVFAPDGKHVLIAGQIRPAPKAPMSGGVQERDAASGKAVRFYRGTAEFYSMLAISRDGKTIAAAGSTFRPGGGLAWSVAVWDRGVEKPRLKLDVFGDYVYGVAFSPDGAVLAVGDTTSVRAWEVATGKHLFQTRLWCVGLAFHPTGRVLAASEGTGTQEVVFLDPTTGRPRGSVKLAEDWRPTRIAFSPDGKRLAVGVSKGYMPGDPVLPERPAAAVWDVAVPPAGDVAVTNERRAANLRADRILNRIAFSPDGKHVAAGCLDRIHVYSAATCELIAALDAKAGHHVLAVAFSPDGKRLFTTATDALTMWSVAELLKRKPK